MDLHDLALERSLAYHREVARRLAGDPSVLEMARGRVQRWLIETPDRGYVREWHRILSLDVESIAAFISGRSELAVELRQSSPFAGVLRPRERWQLWRETRDAINGER